MCLYFSTEIFPQIKSKVMVSIIWLSNYEFITAALLLLNYDLNPQNILQIKYISMLLRNSICSVAAYIAE